MSGEKKQAVAERLAEIAALNDGRITPDMVLADASNPDSPMHDLIEWDDEKAAHKHRLQQCRNILSTVTYKWERIDRVMTAPAYVRDPEADGSVQGYVSIAKLATEEDLARDAMRAEIRRVMSTLARAQAIAEVLGLVSELAGLINATAMFMSRLDESVTAETTPPPQ